MVRYLQLAVVLYLTAGPALAGSGTELPNAPVDDDYHSVRLDEAKLGRLLFYDPILSGNRNISCASCHHPRFATGDGVSLGLGEGGTGLGPQRRVDPDNPPEQRIPRNATALFNLGAKGFDRLFHDGRVELAENHKAGLRTPLEDSMMQGFASVLSAQTMFPVLSPDEMAGHYAENDVSKLVRSGRLTGPDGAWGILAKRVADLPAYADGFADVYPEIAQGRQIAFTDISNAIAAFIAFEWRSDKSLFDAYLRGQADLPVDAKAGLELFYGKARCASCHSGSFLTDQDFHAMGAPQLGPGKAERFERHADDLGRMRVTGDPRDAYKFRTPSLRNVSQTGPWGHAGGHAELSEFVAYHADPVGQASAFRRDVTLPELKVTKPDWSVMDNAGGNDLILAAVTTPPISLNAAELAQIVAFLNTLTDRDAITGRLGIPEGVPSGLVVER